MTNHENHKIIVFNNQYEFIEISNLTRLKILKNTTRKRYQLLLKKIKNHKVFEIQFHINMIQYQ